MHLLTSWITSRKSLFHQLHVPVISFVNPILKDFSSPGDHKIIHFWSYHSPPICTLIFLSTLGVGANCISWFRSFPPIVCFGWGISGSVGVAGCKYSVVWSENFSSDRQIFDVRPLTPLCIRRSLSQNDDEKRRDSSFWKGRRKGREKNVERTPWTGYHG